MAVTFSDNFDAGNVGLWDVDIWPGTPAPSWTGGELALAGSGASSSYYQRLTAVGFESSDVDLTLRVRASDDLSNSASAVVINGLKFNSGYGTGLYGDPNEASDTLVTGVVALFKPGVGFYLGYLSDSVATWPTTISTTNLDNRIRLKRVGDNVYLKVWANGSAEPGTWGATMNISGIGIGSGYLALVRDNRYTTTTTFYYDDVVAVGDGVAAPPNAYVVTSTIAGAAGSVTSHGFTIPSEAQDNDFAVISIATANSAPPTPPGGFEHVVTQSSSTTLFVHVYKGAIMASQAGTNISFSSASTRSVRIFTLIRGGEDVVATSGYQTSTSVTTAQIPEITTTDRTLQLGFFGYRGTAGTIRFNTPILWVERHDIMYGTANPYYGQALTARGFNSYGLLPSEGASTTTATTKAVVRVAVKIASGPKVPQFRGWGIPAYAQPAV